MVFGKDFLWLHLGKTGGTTVEYILSNFCSEIVEYADKFHQEEKHDDLENIQKRFPNTNFKTKTKVINFRNILDFIVSHNFDRLKSPKTNLDDMHIVIKQSKKGLLYTENGWKTVDEYTHRYFSNIDFYIRTEFLVDDFYKVFKKYKPDLNIPHDAHLHKNKDKSIIDFTQAEINEIHFRNPQWMKIQKELYGS